MSMLSDEGCSSKPRLIQGTPQYGETETQEDTRTICGLHTKQTLHQTWDFLGARWQLL